MATTQPLLSPSSSGSVSQDDRGGLWMEVESNPEEDASTAKDGPSLTSSSGERTSDDWTSQNSAPPSSVPPPCGSNGLEDEEDDVFILPALCTATSLPAEGSGGAVERGVRVPDGVSSVTGTQVNPQGLDGEQGKRHNSTSLEKENGLTGRGGGEGGEDQEAGKHSQEPGSGTETSSVPAPSTEEFLARESLLPRGKVEEGAGEEQVIGSQREEPTSGGAGEEGAGESVSCPAVVMEVLGTNAALPSSPSTETEGGTTPVSEEGSSDLTFPSEEIQEPMGENSPPEEDSSQAQPRSSLDDSIGEAETDPVVPQKASCGPPELCQCEKNNKSNEERPAEETGTDTEKVESRFLDYGETKQLWVRRESSSSESSKLPLSISRDSSREGLTAAPTTSDQQGEVEEEEVGAPTVPTHLQEGEAEKWTGLLAVATYLHEGEAENGSDLPAVPTHLQEGEAEKGADVPAGPTYLQQGEQLLHRLHEVQKRQQELQVSDEPPPSQQDARETTNEDEGEHEVDGAECMSVGEEGVREQVARQRDQGETELSEKERDFVSQVEIEEAETGQDITTREEPTQVSLSILVHPSSALPYVRMETNDDDRRDRGISADSSPLSTQEVHSIQTSVQTTQTTTQTSTQPSAHPTNQTPSEDRKQKDRHFRSSRSQSDTEENQDVMEIPFKSSTLLSMPLQPPRASPGQGMDWQFSDKKMQKEISQDMQKELVLVNLGKIPGVYSKGLVGQLKEKKLLFEAFQQGSTEGPTRHRKPPAYFAKGLGVRGHVYPSVLERTRSLEVLHNKKCSLPRTSSLRLQRPKESCSDSDASAEKQLPGKRATRQLVIMEGDAMLVVSNQDRRHRLSRSMDSLSLEDGEKEVAGGEGPKRREKGGVGEASPALTENPFFKLRPALALKPEVEKDIREAREREEDLRRQRCSLYGKGLSTEDDRPSSPITAHPGPSVATSGLGLPSKGKLDRAWPPPPSSNIKESSGQIQGPRSFKTGAPKTPLWQRWEAGLVNGQQPK